MPKIARRTRKPNPTITINVTRSHIDESMRKDSSHCMIAEAIKDALPQARRIAVDLQTIRWTDSENGFRYINLTPRITQDRLVASDFDLEDEPDTDNDREGEESEN